MVRDGEYVELPGAHTFAWLDPESWSEPIRSFAARVAGQNARHSPG
jgi:hypothetical protein